MVDKWFRERHWVLSSWVQILEPPLAYCNSKASYNLSSLNFFICKMGAVETVPLQRAVVQTGWDLVCKVLGTVLGTQGTQGTRGGGVLVLLLVPDRREEPSDAGGFGGARRDHVRSNGWQGPRGKSWAGQGWAWDQKARHFLGQGVGSWSFDQARKDLVCLHREVMQRAREEWYSEPLSVPDPWL